MTKLLTLFLVSISSAAGLWPTNPLSNSKWTLFSITDFTKNEVLKVDKGTSTISFTDSLFYISACNAITAKYRIDANRHMTATSISTTDMHCPFHPLDKIEDYITKCFFDLKIEFNKDTLELCSDKKIVFTFLPDK